MGDGHGAVALEQKRGHRLADDVGAADDHRLLAGQIADGVLEHQDAALRRAGNEGLAAGPQAAGIDDVKAVDVLVRIDGIDHGIGIDLVGQGELDQDAVDAVVGVELFDQRQQLGLRGGVGQAVVEGLHAGLDDRLALVAHIDLARRVLADQHDGEAGGDAVRGRNCAHGLADPRA